MPKQYSIEIQFVRTTCPESKMYVFFVIYLFSVVKYKISFFIMYNVYNKYMSTYISFTISHHQIVNRSFNQLVLLVYNLYDNTFIVSTINRISTISCRNPFFYKKIITMKRKLA